MVNPRGEVCEFNLSSSSLEAGSEVMVITGTKGNVTKVKLEPTAKYRLEDINRDDLDDYGCLIIQNEDIIEEIKNECDIDTLVSVQLN